MNFSPGSLGLECWRLFIVKVLCACLEFCILSLLSRASPRSNFSELALVLAISKDLLSTKVLLLESPQALSLLLLFLCHFSLTHLHLSLEHHLIFLLRCEALESVWLDTVIRKHRLLSGWILSHEVMSIGVVDISGGLELLVGSLCDLFVTLLLGQLSVGILNGALHLDACGCVFGLRIL